MDLNFLIAILIALAPVVLTILVSRAYNIFHGLITFLVMGYVLLFCVDMFGASLAPEVLMYLGVSAVPSFSSFPLPYGTLGLYLAIHTAVLDYMNTAGLATLLADPNLKYYILGACAVVFLVSQLIAMRIRKKRVAKIKRLRRYLKRY